MRVQEVMTPEVEFIDADSTLHDAAFKMKAHNIGPLPVCCKGCDLGAGGTRAVAE